MEDGGLHGSIFDISIASESVDDHILLLAHGSVNDAENNDHQECEESDSEGPGGHEHGGLAVEVLAEVAVTLVVLGAVTAANSADRLALVHGVVADANVATVAVFVAEEAVVLGFNGLAGVAIAELGGALGIVGAVASVGVVALVLVDGTGRLANTLRLVAVLSSAVSVIRTRVSLSYVEPLPVEVPIPANSLVVDIGCLTQSKESQNDRYKNLLFHLKKFIF